MANTYTLITSTTLGANAATVTLSSIPQTFTHLVLRSSRRLDSQGAAYYGYDRFNGNTSAVYSDNWLAGYNGTVSSSYDGVMSFLWDDPYTVSGLAGPTNAFSSNELFIANYTSSAAKSMNYEYAVGANTAIGVAGFSAGLFNSTSAITSITISLYSTFQYVTGTSLYLYGLS